MVLKILQFENMLLGQFDGTVGAKHRTAFPKTFRDVLGDKLIITRGFEGSLIIVSEELWKSLLEGTEGMPFTVQGTRDTQRFLLGNAAFVRLDEKGRFILPEHLKRYGEIIENVVYIGISRYVEMWAQEKWEAYNQNLSQNIATIAEKLTKISEK